jgi:hypothetical protein
MPIRDSVHTLEIRTNRLKQHLNAQKTLGIAVFPIKKPEKMPLYRRDAAVLCPMAIAKGQK